MSEEQPKARKSSGGVVVEGHAPAVDNPDSCLDVKAWLSSDTVFVAIRDNMSADDSTRLEVEINKGHFIDLFRTIFPGFLEQGNGPSGMRMMIASMNLGDESPDDDEDDDDDDE